MEPKSQGKKPRLTAEQLLERGDVCLSEGEGYKALESYFPAMKALEKDLGPKHPLVATAYYGIGRAYDSKQRHIDALYYYRKALEIREEVLGQFHPDTAVIYKYLAHIHCWWGYDYWFWNCDDDLSYMLSNMRSDWFNDDVCSDHYDRALDYYKKALRCYESATPPDESSIREVKEAIDVMASEMEKESHAALECYLKVLEIRKRLYGADSREVDKIKHYISVVNDNIRNSKQLRESNRNKTL